MLANSVASAFTEMEGDNYLELVKVNIVAKRQQLSVPRNTYMSNYMSTDEVGKIIQLPTADLQHEFSDELSRIGC